jgi:hypothetical protein
MTRVTLIVTGDVEHKALHESLGRIFSGVEFRSEILGSFTSTPLPPEPRIDFERPTLVQKLAGALVAAVDPGRQGTPADFAVLVDDLELANMANAERAIHHVRVAVRAHIENHFASGDRRNITTKRVRERCSFHLLAPMVEAYFFGEPAALERAGAIRPSTVDPSSKDLEDFMTEDSEFLSHPDTDGHPWAKPDRARHPKSYLKFLCDPTGKKSRAYQETKGGHEALRALDWSSVLAQKTYVRFARALLVDLALALEQHQVAARFPGAPHPLTSQTKRGNVLRNL